MKNDSKKYKIKNTRIHRVVYKPQIVSIDDIENCPQGTLLFGGPPSWRNKILSKFKHIKGVNLTQQFNSNIINHNTKMILINTNYLGHGLFQRIQKSVSNKDIKISYIK